MPGQAPSLRFLFFRQRLKAAPGIPLGSGFPCHLKRIERKKERPMLTGLRAEKGKGSWPISRVLSGEHLPWAAIPLGAGSPRRSSGLPGNNGAGHARVPLFGLAPDGVCRAVRVATDAVGSYPRPACADAASPQDDAHRFTLAGVGRYTLRRSVLCCTPASTEPVGQKALSKRPLHRPSGSSGFLRLLPRPPTGLSAPKYREQRDTFHGLTASGR